MAKITRGDLFSQDSTDSGPAIVEALAPLATGVNKDGTSYATEPADTVATGSLTAVAQAVTMAIPTGMTTASWVLTGTFVATTVFEISYDGGTTYLPAAATLASALAGGVAIQATTTNQVWEAAIPAGATHVRGRCSAFTSGSVALRVNVSWSPYEPAVSIASIGANAALINSNAVIGGATKSVLTNDETASVGATLANATTGFGGIRDLQGSATGASSAGSGRYPDRLRAHVSADQPFTLGVEFDAIAGMTSSNEAGNVAAVAGRLGRYFASLDVAVLNRYGRCYVTNTGAAAMTNLRAFTTQVG